MPAVQWVNAPFPRAHAPYFRLVLLFRNVPTIWESGISKGKHNSTKQTLDEGKLEQMQAYYFLSSIFSYDIGGIKEHFKK